MILQYLILENGCIGTKNERMIIKDDEYASFHTLDVMESMRQRQQILGKNDRPKVKQRLSFPSNLQDRPLYDHTSAELLTRIYEFCEIGIGIQMVW
jgi:hypothetical protein